MGTYVNPGNMGFRRARKGEYVDKSGLISLVNGAIGGPQNLICVSRPRRFGKSYAAEMLCSYYSCGCNYYADAILSVVRSTGRPFIFLIDEWDAPIREQDEGSQTVRVPNEEVRLEFVSSLERGCHPEVRRLVEAADATLTATLAEDADAVAASVGAGRLSIQWIHQRSATLVLG